MSRHSIHRDRPAPHHPYATATTLPSSVPQHSPSLSTSSAFSANALPNEDWTKISDLAERRRIQNRIAQRNYRKKLKRRLEDLERKATPESNSPEPSPADPDDFKSDASGMQMQRKKSHQQHRHSSSGLPRQMPPTPEPQHDAFYSSTQSMFSNPPYLASHSPPLPNVTYASYNTEHTTYSPHLQSKWSQSYSAGPDHQHQPAHASYLQPSPALSAHGGQFKPDYAAAAVDDFGAYGPAVSRADMQQYYSNQSWQSHPHDPHTPELSYSQGVASPAFTDALITPPHSISDPLEDFVGGSNQDFWDVNPEWIGV